MKKFLTVLGYTFLVIVLLFGFCGNIVSSLQDNRQAAVDEGYDQGYRAGAAAAKKQIENQLRDDFWDLGSSRNSEYGLGIEDAIHILRLYDEGEPVSDTELSRAIDVVRSFYLGLDDLISGIDNYWVD